MECPPCYLMWLVSKMTHAKVSQGSSRRVDSYGDVKNITLEIYNNRVDKPCVSKNH